MSKYQIATNPAPSSFTMATANQVATTPVRDASGTLVYYDTGIVPSSLTTAEIATIAAAQVAGNPIGQIVYNSTTNAFTGIGANGTITPFAGVNPNATNYGGITLTGPGVQVFGGAGWAKMTGIGGAWSISPAALSGYVASNANTTLTAPAGAATVGNVSVSGFVQSDTAGVTVLVAVYQAGAQVPRLTTQTTCDAQNVNYPFEVSTLRDIAAANTFEIWVNVSTTCILTYGIANLMIAGV